MGTNIMLFASLRVAISFPFNLLSLRPKYLLSRFIKSTKLRMFDIFVVCQCITHTSCLPSCPRYQSGHSVWVDEGMIYPQVVLLTPF